jgi:hypothetical protein
MNDVVISKCTLRIVRHGGWAWGSRRRAIYENATAALPRLIAERLAELLGDVEGEIAQPIRLRFALRAGQLASGEGLAAVVRSGIRPELLPVPAPKQANAAQGREAAPRLDTVQTQARQPALRIDADATDVLPGPARMLLRWREQGALWQRLLAFPGRALDLWLSALLSELPPGSPAASIPEALRRECIAMHRSVPVRPDDPLHADRARLALAVELVSRHAGALSADILRRLLEEVLPAPVHGHQRVASPVEREGSASGTARPPDGVTVRERPAPSERPPTAPARGDPTRVELCSVLPFLVLGVLHRLGWLDVASAALRALDLPDRGSILATALAYKLLPGADRGWHRHDAVLRTAAAFAGVRVPPSSLEIARWSRDADGGLCPLDDFVAGELARGHDCSLPLIVMRVDSRHDLPWLLFDADGRLPVGWHRDEAAVRSVLRRFGPCLILVSSEAATPAFMSALEADHRSFVTSATPARGDDWRRVKGTACWAGGAQALPRRVVDAAGMLPELMAQALAVNRELLHARPAASPREAAQLEHCAALAAATGLGSMAWILWRDREPVHPLLALDRFANLDGTAHTHDGIVEIRPAFGRRYLDLQKHGLLADIPAPAWLDARRIVFAGP